jgi:hypothetical protein
MFAILHALGSLLVDLFKSRSRLEAENLFLRQQLHIALRRAPPRLRKRLIGTLRRECLDQMVICGEAHLRRIILSVYAAYYNQARPHLALQKDAPLRRAVQRFGGIVAIPILAGLHHQYVRI